MSMTDKTELILQRLPEIEKAELLMAVNTHFSPAHGFQVRRVYAEIDRLRAALLRVTNYHGLGRLGPQYEKEREVMKQCREALE